MSPLSGQLQHGPGDQPSENHGHLGGGHDGSDASVQPAAGTTAEPTYTAAETAAAHQKLCEVYKLAARAVQIATNGDNPAFANIATVNGAVMLQQTLNTTPALVPGERTDALALAEAYGQATAFAMEQDHPAWQSAANDVNAKDARMKAICGGG